MVALQASSLASVSKTVTPNLKIRSAISIPKLPNGTNLLKELNSMSSNTLFKKPTRTIIPLENPTITRPQEVTDHVDVNKVTTTKMHIILEAVLDRIEMHKNIGEQRENWNSLLLNSVNMITLTAATMAGLAGCEMSVSPSLKVSSTLLFCAATGLLLVVNKIQPSQLVEEQRNAVRLLKKLKAHIQTTLSLRNPTEKDVDEAMERVLALDRAYPLPLLGKMLEKFPETFEPAVWWPKKQQSSSSKPENKKVVNNNGWSNKLEEDVREVIGVVKRKDIEDYVRLGNKVLKFNKILAISGPLLTGLAAVGTALSGHDGLLGSWAGLVGPAAGCLASVVNTVEHGGQVGMVFEMYRNCAGFFKLLEENVEGNLQENDFEKRENGELFEMKMALHLGRNLQEFRDFADESRRNGGEVNGFASKLF